MLSDDCRCLQMTLIDFAKCPRPVRVHARAPPTTTRVSLDTCTLAVSPHHHTTSLASARGSLCCSMGAHSLSALEIFAQISNLAPISAVGGVTSHSNGIICGQKRVKYEKDTLGVFRQHTGAPWGHSWRVFTPFYRLHPISPTFANKFRSRGGRIQHDPARVHATRAGFAPQHDTARPSTTSGNLRSLQFRSDALR